MLRRILEVPALPDSWRDHFAEMLENISSD
jgi:hypothetical protein